MKPALLTALFLSVPLIAHAQQAERMITRHYKLSERATKTLHQKARRLGLNPGIHYGGGGGGGGGGAPALNFGGNEEDTEMDALQDFLKACLAREDWASDQASMSYDEDTQRFTVTQTPAIHKRLSKLFTRLEEISTGLLTVTIEAYQFKGQGPTTGLCAGTPVDKATRAHLSKLVVSGQLKRLGLLDLRLPDGATRVTEQLRGEDLLSDFEVNQTGVVPIYNPVISRLWAGISASARALHGPETVSLELRLQFAQKLHQRDIRFLTQGTLQLPELRLIQLGSSLKAKYDSSVVLALQTGGSHKLLVIATVGSAPTKPVVKSPRWIERYPLSSLVNPDDSLAFKEAASPLNQDDEELLEERAAPLMDRLREELKRRARLHRSDENLFVFADRRGHKQTRDLLHKLQFKASLCFEVLQLQVPADKLPTAASFDSKALDELVRKASSVRRHSLLGLQGQEVGLNNLHRAYYVAQYEHSSGGSGKDNMAKVADPIVTTVDRGPKLKARAWQRGEKVLVQVTVNDEDFSGFGSVNTKHGAIDLPKQVKQSKLSASQMVKPGHAIAIMRAVDDKGGQLWLLRVNAPSPR